MTQLTFATMMPLPSMSMTPQSPKQVEPLSSEELHRRKNFCIFLKILSHTLSKTDPLMKQKVKELVRVCTKKNREGDVNFEKLMESVQYRLRHLLGERQWQQFQIYTDHVLASHCR